jgi:hypothetical protein
MPSNRTARKDRHAQPPKNGATPPDLPGRYGKIGCPVVAAASHYPSIVARRPPAGGGHEKDPRVLERLRDDALV